LSAAKSKEIKCGVVGYGGAFNMGKAHAEWMNASPGMRTVAVCDIDEERLNAARQQLGDVAVFKDLASFLASDVDLVAIVTPHNTHYAIAMESLKAGKHVVIEKPMCLTVEEATDMIETAKKSGVTLTVFHNRRHDGDYMAVKELIDKGIIGEVFHIESYMGGYHHPGKWWRSSKEISGGLFYDWGAHIVDWTLNFYEGREIESITGFFHKRVWMDVTNEDQVQALVRMSGGAVADIQMSSIARAGKPRWRILGTKGAIVDEWKGSFRVYTDVQGYPAEMEIKYKQSTWEQWYPNLAKHLLEGAPLEVTPESSRRVIQIISFAERSAKAGKTIPAEYP